MAWVNYKFNTLNSNTLKYKTNLKKSVRWSKWNEDLGIGLLHLWWKILFVKHKNPQVKQKVHTAYRDRLPAIKLMVYLSTDILFYFKRI